jgi:hypothetical protein
MEIIKTHDYTFPWPSWSSFSNGKGFLCSNPQAVYAAFENEKL